MTVYAATFSDVNESDGSLYTAVEYLAAKGIMSGTGNGLFEPDGLLTRMDMAVIMCRATGVDITFDFNNEYFPADSSSMPPTLIMFAVRAIEYGWMLVDENGNFNPNNKITLEETALAVAHVVEEFDPNFDYSFFVDDFYDSYDSKGRPHTAKYKNAVGFLSIIDGTMLSTITQPWVQPTQVLFINDEISRGRAAKILYKALTWTKTGTFIDVPASEWFYDSVEFMSAKDIMNGIGAGVFNPYGLLNRWQMAIVMCKISGVDMAFDQNELNKSPISDKSELKEWFVMPSVIAVREGWMVLDNNDKFNPEATLTRQEIALILAKYMNYNPSKANLSVLNNFKDKDDVDNAYRPAMAYMVECGFIRGTSEGELNPKGAVNRATAAVLFYNVLMMTGDLNGSFNLDTGDLVLLAQHIAEINKITDPDLLKKADINKDEKINIVDLILLSKLLANG